MSHFAEYGEGKYKVWADLIDTGNDLLVYMGGGEKPHIGGASFASPIGFPFTLSCPTHKDYIVSSSAARKIATFTGRKCLVVVGIHVDNASMGEIGMLVRNSEGCVDQLISKMENRNP